MQLYQFPGLLWILNLSACLSNDILGQNKARHNFFYSSNNMLTDFINFYSQDFCPNRCGSGGFAPLAVLWPVTRLGRHSPVHRRSVTSMGPIFSVSGVWLTGDVYIPSAGTCYVQWPGKFVDAGRGDRFSPYLAERPDRRIQIRRRRKSDKGAGHRGKVAELFEHRRGVFSVMDGIIRVCSTALTDQRRERCEC